MLAMIAHLRRVVSFFRFSAPLPPAAQAERERDQQGLPESDPGIDRAMAAALAWLGQAQDHSRTQDGGVARHYSLLNGWGSSYPETTGYLVPTLLACARDPGQAEADVLRPRARRMLDWLVSIQLSDGGFQGGMVDQLPVKPVTFNTGQILLGLAAGVAEFGPVYLEPLRRAADWLIATQDADGCWRRYPTPFAAPGEKVYETHVAWGLLEADRVAPGRGYREAALGNIRWALQLQRPNGWFDRCCLSATLQVPLTHTLGYTLRGVLEGYRASGDETLLQAARRAADGLGSALRADGFLPGRLDANWRGVVRWACLTGSVQIAHCWLILHGLTGDPTYREAAFAANAYVRRTMHLDGPPETRGAIKGSFPIDGDYAAYEYVNWAPKFFLDSHRLEREVRARQGRLVPEVMS
jgi:hypothetical protein